MKFFIVFFIALLAIALARPHSSESSGSDEHQHKGMPHHKHHHRHTHRPRTTAPVTTEESSTSSDAPATTERSSISSDAPSNPTETAPFVSSNGVSVELPGTTPNAPARAVEVGPLVA
ncbi:hypothetical protein GCK32_006970 [Trichostrongylus colubriformis]|uniref:Uncharacterized protein n=1 Tax=Trichostrongylus colubriformis TaxID=6319 RepID=A0AAN8F7G3_TRICO